MATTEATATAESHRDDDAHIASHTFPEATKNESVEGVDASRDEAQPDVALGTNISDANDVGTDVRGNSERDEEDRLSDGINSMEDSVSISSPVSIEEAASRVDPETRSDTSSNQSKNIAAYLATLNFTAGVLTRVHPS
jgi:hypothetical protein